MAKIGPTSRTTLQRNPVRSEHDRRVIDAILDEAFLCHVAFLHEGKPACVPTAFGRDGDWLYLHGHRKNRALLATLDQDCCLNVTVLDGFVLARSTFHHSFNYRSVVVYGKSEEVTEEAEKLRAVNLITDHIVPGRTGEARTPNAKELAATLVVRLPLAECSGKVRTGPPGDDAEDMSFPVWAGVLPVHTTYGSPEPAPDLAPGVEPSSVVAEYRRPANSSS